MDNNQIADNFSLLSKLMDIHGENSFKIKSYAAAAFAIEKLNISLADLPIEKIAAIKGIGDTTAKKIVEQIESGKLAALDELISKTPPGILEMLLIKGIGPKKIATIWKELEIESLGELLYACYENRLTRYKGFGEKTQKNIQEAIEFYMGSIGSYLYQQIESYALALQKALSDSIVNQQFILAGQMRRQLPVIDKLEWVTTADSTQLIAFFEKLGYTYTNIDNHTIVFKGAENIPIHFKLCSSENIGYYLWQSSASEAFLNSFAHHFPQQAANKQYATEQDLWNSCQIPEIPAALRETGDILEVAKQQQLPQLIATSDIKGIIHCHSNWSDGANSIEEMVDAAQRAGLEYIVLSDHSKSAFYAQGLYEDKVLAQHRLIDSLNSQLNTRQFKIFKSIESDILSDGSLDYDESILKQFDLIIASIHSNLKMPQEKAMMRLLKAIENPYTSILGHMTGRLLLSRAGYPVDHEKIIDACAANQVVIELNAHPRRLDIDWTWIKKALDKNVLISINPDAHHTDGFADCKYGVLAAQKGWLTKNQNLSSFGLAQIEVFIQSQKQKRPN